MSVRERRGPRSVRTLDATWSSVDGETALEAALERLAREAVAASRRGAEVLVISDAAATLDRLAVPSILAVGAVHAALTAAGLRGRTDLAVSAADVLDVHSMAMVLAVGATVVHPRLAIELAAELAGTRGAESLTPTETIARLMTAFEAGLRKTLARMGISAVASYIGGSLVDVVDLDVSVVARCFPTAAAWPGRTTLADLAGRQIRRRAAALAIPEPAAGRDVRLPDPGFARFRCRRRGPSLLAEDRRRDHAPGGRRSRWRRPGRDRRPARSLPRGTRPPGDRPRAAA